MSNFSFSKQQNQMDCGPTCLYMISRYYGRVFSMEKLRELTEIGKEGVSLLGISDAAEKIGFQTTALQIPYRDSSFIIKVKLQNGLLTNYKKTIHFTNNLTGAAEIITNDATLAERLLYQWRGLFKR